MSLVGISTTMHIGVPLNMPYYSCMAMKLVTVVSLYHMCHWRSEAACLQESLFRTPAGLQTKARNVVMWRSGFTVVFSLICSWLLNDWISTIYNQCEPLTHQIIIERFTLHVHTVWFTSCLKHHFNHLVVFLYRAI